jgi:hypothetical protein
LKLLHVPKRCRGQGRSQRGEEGEEVIMVKEVRSNHGQRGEEGEEEITVYQRPFE